MGLDKKSRGQYNYVLHMLLTCSFEKGVYNNSTKEENKNTAKTSGYMYTGFDLSLYIEKEHKARFIYWQSHCSAEMNTGWGLFTAVILLSHSNHHKKKQQQQNQARKLIKYGFNIFETVLCPYKTKLFWSIWTYGLFSKAPRLKTSLLYLNTAFRD